MPEELINLAQTRNARKASYKDVNLNTSGNDIKEARIREDEETDVCWGDNEIKKGEDDNVTLL